MTAALVVVDAVFVALLVSSWFYMPGGLFLLVILGYGTMLMLHIPRYRARLQAVSSTIRKGRCGGTAAFLIVIGRLFLCLSDLVCHEEDGQPDYAGDNSDAVAGGEAHQHHNQCQEYQHHPWGHLANGSLK